VGRAFALNGSAFVEMPDKPALRPVSLTLEAWVMFDTPKGIQPVFAKPVGTGVLDSYTLWLQHGNLMGAAAGTDTPLSVAFIPVPARWYHLAYAFENAKRHALYIDGDEVAAGTLSASISYDDKSLFLGHEIDMVIDPATGKNVIDPATGKPLKILFFLQGRIDEASLYNRALEPADIAAIYRAGPAGKL
jgi:hypothetical protein